MIQASFNTYYSSLDSHTLKTISMLRTRKKKTIKEMLNLNPMSDEYVLLASKYGTFSVWDEKYNYLV